ncbi:hypothetical protein BV25DRAFT_1920372 [Artomyces pyxidatus]|uniref:Uncharacterized protein n=1 Tax=Artomyces pyxidatus TaxID=48021 RepID=A0ACB8SN50_9AGAM|nr:hypothetical protein BV25DRAFT_1920372 [Artomyces pyxidatus]
MIRYPYMRGPNPAVTRLISHDCETLSDQDLADKWGFIMAPENIRDRGVRVDDYIVECTIDIYSALIPCSTIRTVFGIEHPRPLRVSVPPLFPALQRRRSLFFILKGIQPFGPCKPGHRGIILSTETGDGTPPLSSESLFRHRAGNVCSPEFLYMGEYRLIPREPLTVQEFCNLPEYVFREWCFQLLSSCAPEMRACLSRIARRYNTNAILPSMIYNDFLQGHESFKTFSLEFIHFDLNIFKILLSSGDRPVNQSWSGLAVESRVLSVEGEAYLSDEGSNTSSVE